jgi:protease-4
MQKSTPWIIFGVLAGVIFLVLLSVLLAVGARGSGNLAAGKSVGLIEVEGVITDSRRVVRSIRRFVKEPDVPVILLRVDSPGGTVTPSQEIYAELKRAKAKGKKLVVSMGTVAASGGYYISAPADVIVANPSTMTGSIGVIMELPNVEGLLKKLGLSVEVVKSREFKDIGSPYRPMKPEERELLKGVILDVYDQFVSAVAEDRNLPRDSVERLADGRIFTGRQAKEIGLVDSLGTYEDAVLIAGELAGIKGEPRIVRLPKTFRLWEFVFEDLGGRFLMPKLEYLFR